ncbi:sister chromatid cohesion protein DCC1-like [Tropilaelaps mercedesae]|uniref:Sister chromatid cohesion protein DCC1 n=1 Tax=Tropilaelaps mercedesae TaxID=418985 RepID=A0A1V9X1G8_9ACAR|nr:sister chromatid cohesion protein DCC1-like [Tropilaelaps mercedesae]
MAPPARRSLAEISAKLTRAKLSREDMQPVTQSVFFHPEANDDVLLIEVDAHLLEEAKGGGIIIRGDPDDELVLCTGTQTYSVREAEISNSLLVVPGLQLASKGRPLTGGTSTDDGVHTLQVLKTLHLYWEPRAIRPSPRKLHRLLAQSEFRGVELECDIQTSALLSLSGLLEQVQASEKELLEMLQSLPVAEVDGHFRLLGFEYHFRILEFMLTSIESNSMLPNNIDVDLVIEEVSELEPRAIVQAVVSWYVKDQVLLKERVSRTQAEALLRSGESFNLEQFLATWQQSLPEGLTTDVTYLYGISYVDEDRQRPTIHYLSVWDLPEAENARFDTLLRLKTYWKLDEIGPYISDLSLRSVNSLLLKYARSFRKNGQVLYSKK